MEDKWIENDLHTLYAFGPFNLLDSDIESLQLRQQRAGVGWSGLTYT